MAALSQYPLTRKVGFCIALRGKPEKVYVNVWADSTTESRINEIKGEKTSH